jgi:hypothetical protein
MNRFKFFIFAPRKVRCYACKAEGQSKLAGGHQLMFVFLLVFAAVVTWLTGMIPGAPRPITLGSWFGPQYTPILVGVWWLIALSTLFSPKGHRCRECGSEFLKPL